MREINFRVWNKEVKLMEDFDYDLFVSKNTLYRITEECEDYEIYMKQVNVTTEYDLMQYTGLRDKRYKKIYVKDIVLTENGEYAIVEEGLGYYGLVYIDDLNDKSIVKPIKPTSYTWGQMQSKIKVVGNIYENKDYLTCK